MKLPIPSFGKKEKQKYILSLLLRDEKISALITEEVEGKMSIVGQHEEILTTPLEHLTSEEWLDSLDRVISRAEETLPPDRETHDTVFGVKESWVEDKKIKKEYLLKLKKLSEALDLTPIGFLVISEAITHLIQAEEGAPVSAILVDIGKLSVTATLVRGGKVIESKSITRDDSLPGTVDTALKHLQSVDVFPARVILFLGSSPVGDKEDTEHLAQQFISHHWSKSLPFLHPPQISLLNGGFDAKAVVQGAASQMGFEVLNLTDHPQDEITNLEATEKPSHTKHSEGEKPSTHTEKKHTSKEVEKLSNPAEDAESDADFGFLMDQDISEHPPVVKDNFETVSFSEPPDHPKPVSHQEEERENRDIMQEAAEYEDDSGEEDEVAGKKNPLGFLTGLFTGLPIGKIGSPLKRIAVPAFLSGPGRNMLLIPLGILLLLGVLYFLYTSNLKAEVTLYLKPNNVTEDTDVRFSTDSGNTFSDGIIAAKTISTDLDGKVTTPATGKKAVGEKAKGSVTIYNNDEGKKQIPGGTTITTDKGLKFTTDKEVSIASASGDIFSGTKPGTAQVAVTAGEFGSDYNLPSGTKFNVTGISNVAAKNDSAFSGGTKKEVTVVSKKDQDKLISELSKSLQEKALGELEQKVTDDQKLLRFLTQASVTKKTFDNKVDSEAKNVTLSGTVSFEALTYSQKDVEDYAQVALKNKYNDNLNLSDKGVSFTMNNEKQKDEGEVQATLTITAGLVPKIDTSAVISRIKGMSVTQANEELKKLPQVSDAKIQLTPSIPLIPVFLPKQEDRIVLTTALHE